MFKLHLAIGDFDHAISLATSIASQEQRTGTYQAAHDILFTICRELIKNELQITESLSQSLMLIHSYLLVKTWISLKDHETAARLLIRVSKSISKFPAHVVPILTSTVVQCQRSGLKQSAHENATILMRPEYRKLIVKSYKKKVENLVRRPPTDDDKPEILTPCPFCKFRIPETRLDCPSCKNKIPYCIVTGKHILQNDLTICPHCQFPAIYSKFVQFLQTNIQCPMCLISLNPNQLSLQNQGFFGFSNQTDFNADSEQQQQQTNQF